MLAARPSRLRCAWCRDDLGHDVLTCPGCRTLIHVACELDACPTLGCGSLAPWELVLRPRPWATLFALWLALCLLTTAVTTLALFWPSEAPRPDTRPASRPDPEVRELDPWFWWAPGTELVVRSRIRQAMELRHLEFGAPRDGEPTLREWSEWEREDQELLDGYQLVTSTDHHVLVKGCEVRAHHEWLPLDRPPWGDEGRVVLEERADAPVDTPAGRFVTRYRRSTTRGVLFRAWWFEHGGSASALTTTGTDVVEETWTDPRVPVPLRRRVTWREPDAPPELQACSLESVVVSIRGRARAW